MSPADGSADVVQIQVNAVLQCRTTVLAAKALQESRYEMA